MPVITEIELCGMKSGGEEADCSSIEKRGGENMAWAVMNTLLSPPVYRASGRDGGEQGR